MVRLLSLVCLLNKRAELQEVRTGNLGQVIGDRKAVVPRKDWVAVCCVQIVSPVIKHTDWNVRVGSGEEADLIEPQRRIRDLTWISEVVIELQLAGAKQHFVSHARANDIGQVDHHRPAEILALEFAGDFVVR